MTASDTDVEAEPAPERAFLRIEYVARSGDGRIIDTTDPEAAAESDLDGLEASGPVTVVPGEGHLFEPLEAALRDAEAGTTVGMTVDPEDAFGAADPDSMVTLGEEAIAPERREPGKTVELGGRRAAVEAVEEGTVTVDFGHPLAGVTLSYEIEVLERLTDLEARAAGLAKTHGLRDASVEYDRDVGELTVRLSTPEPDADRDARTRAYVDDARRLLDVPSVTVIQRYG